MELVEFPKHTLYVWLVAFISIHYVHLMFSREF